LSTLLNFNLIALNISSLKQEKYCYYSLLVVKYVERVKKMFSEVNYMLSESGEI